MSKKEENKYDFTQTIVTKIISEQDKLAMSVINEYCKKKNIIPNIISEEKLKAVLDLGMARKTKIDVLQSQLDIANKKLKDGIEFVNNIISETDGCDDCCESEKHLLASEMLSIIGGE